MTTADVHIRLDFYVKPLPADSSHETSSCIFCFFYSFNCYRTEHIFIDINLRPLTGSVRA